MRAPDPQIAQRARTAERSRQGYTLVELLVASAVMVALVAMLISVTDLSAQVFKRTSAKIEQFGEARRAFEAMTRQLAEATLNTYWDYFDINNRPPPTDPKERVNFVPHHYGRASELRFWCGPMSRLGTASASPRPTHGVFFQAPIGEVADRAGLGVLDKSLNTWGYFLEIGDDREFIPAFLRNGVKPRRRSRLLELRQPTENLTVYFPTGMKHWWFASTIQQKTNRPVRVVAENVIALIIAPRLANADERVRELRFGKNDDRSQLSPAYEYDSTLARNPMPPGVGKPQPDGEVNPRHQLPPVVQVVMVAIDEISAARLDTQEAGKPDFGLALETVFQRRLRLEDDPATPAAGDGELAALEAALIARRLTYRIFDTNVIIRGAKWSRGQTN